MHLRVKCIIVICIYIFSMALRLPCCIVVRFLVIPLTPSPVIMSNSPTIHTPAPSIMGSSLHGSTPTYCNLAFQRAAINFSNTIPYASQTSGRPAAKDDRTAAESSRGQHASCITSSSSNAYTCSLTVEAFQQMIRIAVEKAISDKFSDSKSDLFKTI